MIKVEVATQRVDICSICGHEIKKGHVFVLIRYGLPNGLAMWKKAHLYCSAVERERARRRAEGRRLIS